MKAALFDFGGTLYDYETLGAGDRESLVFLARQCGIEADGDAVYRAYHSALRRVFRDYLPRPFYRHVDMFREAATGMVRELGGKVTAAELARYREKQRELVDRDFRLREGVVETLAELRRLGLRLGVVSNIDADQLEHLGTLARLRDHFDWLLSSDEAGSCKPDPAIFAEALRRAGCQPDEALFIGDSLPQDIAGANRAGLRSVLLWHRAERPPPADGVQPRHVISRIADLLEILD